ncbi:uncharacterized protein ACLA_066970 [Aspergillus clavatus NRRL 1]|uniref:Uncharacterized protein n=1 Tax=Aspergillus clavatus (strain ATCC 1007 / CBS 513.65 / DSM 816 / NCTC 3887 / NRRL 1 / QM 1276 / 107) TaxID=344612 RepID=A1CGI1_ASPCL|nr:uncharacterized protein ACLA_066970 [Aspergillus clavatus NRRL 1]EAW11061.1 hypothetical protein ACLA_066970 [Aspergillus clavatus NRRL 1]
MMNAQDAPEPMILTSLLDALIDFRHNWPLAILSLAIVAFWTYKAIECNDHYSRVSAVRNPLTQWLEAYFSGRMSLYLVLHLCLMIDEILVASWMFLVLYFWKQRTLDVIDTGLWVRWIAHKLGWMVFVALFLGLALEGMEDGYAASQEYLYMSWHGDAMVVKSCLPPLSGRASQPSCSGDQQTVLAGYTRAMELHTEIKRRPMPVERAENSVERVIVEGSGDMQRGLTPRLLHPHASHTSYRRCSTTRVSTIYVAIQSRQQHDNIVIPL